MPDVLFDQCSGFLAGYFLDVWLSIEIERLGDQRDLFFSVRALERDREESYEVNHVVPCTTLH